MTCLTTFDSIYRTLCALLYNFAPLSGHPGGSISSGRMIASLLFGSMDFDLTNPQRNDADILSYAAGHKALGLYVLWALSNEIMRVYQVDILPRDLNQQLRLEDLLGFRRNTLDPTPLFTKFKAKILDGHPCPAIPFVKLATGASGVGLGASIGLAFGAIDYYGPNSPRIHIIEGEGGLTPGRVSEALAAAGTASLKNVILHIDWNQSSIDSDRVCRVGSHTGDYVQWDPRELLYLHDWNVISVARGTDFQTLATAQKAALDINNDQPSAIIYRTTKGWHYGIEGKKSHGSGHPLCSNGFKQTLEPLQKVHGELFTICSENMSQCQNGKDRIKLEECFWQALQGIRKIIENDQILVRILGQHLINAGHRLNKKSRKPRSHSPSRETVFNLADKGTKEIPEALCLQPGTSISLREQLGRILGFYNQESRGAMFLASADLLGSTSISQANQDFAAGFYNTTNNPHSRLLALGGICEDAMTSIMSGISSFGRHLGVVSSYGAFMAAMGHTACRLHAIGNQTRARVNNKPYHPLILINAHVGIKTGEDGPSHADPQSLQLLQENFPSGTLITLTPWDPEEIWFLFATALVQRPAIISPFVTRPQENVIDRKKLGLAPVSSTATGVYPLYMPKENRQGCVVLQGSEVAYEFIMTTLPLLQRQKQDLSVFYVSSAELFDLLPADQQEKIFPECLARKAMGISGFTKPTLYRWIHSSYGRSKSLHPFRQGRYLESGKAEMVLKEAGLDGVSQFQAICNYLENIPD